MNHWLIFSFLLIVSCNEKDTGTNSTETDTDTDADTDSDTDADTDSDADTDICEFDLCGEVFLTGECITMPETVGIYTILDGKEPCTLTDQWWKEEVSTPEVNAKGYFSTNLEPGNYAAMAYSSDV